MGKRYCCVIDCHNNAETGVKLHRIPKNPKIRKIWLHRICRKGFVPNENSRLCSAHFPDGYLSHMDLPTHFPHKTYRTAKLGESFMDSVVRDAVEQVFSEPGPNLNESFGNGTQWSVSLLMHDYCGPTDFANCSSSTLRDKSVQCFPNVCDAQTETANRGPSSSTFCSSQTQTDIPTANSSVDSLTEEQIQFYTGVPNKEAFLLLCTILSTPRTEKVAKLKLEDEVLLVLMKLRLNLLFQDLAYRFLISKSTVSRIFSFWINVMAVRLSFLCEWPSQDLVQARQPSCFNDFGYVRAIVDCIEIKCETSSSQQEKPQVCSDYKNDMTWKALVAISSFGAICFVSELFSGSVSDEEMTIRSNFLDGFSAGDSLMTGKSFLINDLCSPRGIHLVKPPKRKKLQSEHQEVEMTRRVADPRIYVKRAVERIKSFKILQYTLPVPLSRHASDIFKVCAYLCNLLPHIIPQDEVSHSQF
ncbi:THAP domain-containing protein [Elysia marginata]|uniref:THAP domain-containing protein n=1 Tax=Elysia marginata TaxID=1093978 RepID=A0AAV4JDT0_9GAST|nr:THAP domain-containing protein [Elysia marginata]